MRRFPFMAAVPLAAVLISAALSGCGPGDDPTVPVAGGVTLDGHPLPSGTITFIPSDGKGAAAGAQVSDGRFEARVTPGPKQVAIIAQRESAKRSKGPADPHAGPPTEQYLPARYNTKTELTAEIPAEGGEGIDFALLSGR